MHFQRYFNKYTVFVVALFTHSFKQIPPQNTLVKCFISKCFESLAREFWSKFFVILLSFGKLKFNSTFYFFLDVWLKIFPRATGKLGRRFHADKRKKRILLQIVGLSQIRILGLQVSNPRGSKKKKRVCNITQDYNILLSINKA